MSSAGSPASYLLWSLLSIMFQVFMLIHLWNYDRFQCIKWNSGRQPGAFKRVMTYSYLATVPLLVVFSIALTALKYQEGYLVVIDPLDNFSQSVYPKPVKMWADHRRDWLLPIYFVLAVAWSLEIVTHLEELTFWLYLMHQGPRKRDWFHSWEFRAWYIGCMTAFLSLFATTVIARHDLETCAAWIFVVGASVGTGITILFLYPLARFPRFIQSIKDEGATPDVVVRLTTFYQLNLARVAFRFLFTVPLLIIGLDGIQSPPHLLRKPFIPDFLFQMGGIGCFISSAITLLVFFPRSVTREQGYKVKVSTPHPSLEKVPAQQRPPTMILNEEIPYHSRPGSSKGAFSPTPSIRMSSFKFPPSNEHLGTSPPRSQHSSGRFYKTDDGEIVEASPEYSQEDQMVDDNDYVEPSIESHELPRRSAVPVEVQQPLQPHEPPHPHQPPKPQLEAPEQSTSRAHSLPPMQRVSYPHSPPPIPPPSAPTTAFLPSPSSELQLRRAVTNSPSPRKARSAPQSPESLRRRRSPSSQNLHPYLQNFTSPIDLLDNRDQAFLPHITKGL
ncbi:hypothetical protein DL96DRAFT_1584041 [Flagelloscypha sp. PMI_526]|nr:hypothetical protein DL96DRAFT_1584041 [Flagelloscypha sp. PMI_526]